MFGNGKGKWTHSYWMKGGVRVNTPVKPGWYAAKPECCPNIVKVYLDSNLLDCVVVGSELSYDIHDFDWWYKLASGNDDLPEFRE